GMMPDPDSGLSARRASRRRIGAGVALLAVAALAAVVLALRFVETERERELIAWQGRLGIVADSRTVAVNEWIGRQYAALTGLAENAALQVYLTALAADPDAAADPGRMLA